MLPGVGPGAGLAHWVLRLGDRAVSGTASGDSPVASLHVLRRSALLLGLIQSEGPLFWASLRTGRSLSSLWGFGFLARRAWRAGRWAAVSVGSPRCLPALWPKLASWPLWFPCCLVDFLPQVGSCLRNSIMHGLPGIL